MIRASLPHRFEISAYFVRRDLLQSKLALPADHLLRMSRVRKLRSAPRWNGEHRGSQLDDGFGPFALGIFRPAAARLRVASVAIRASRRAHASCACVVPSARSIQSAFFRVSMLLLITVLYFARSEFRFTRNEHLCSPVYSSVQFISQSALRAAS